MHTRSAILFMTRAAAPALLATTLALSACDRAASTEATGNPTSASAARSALVPGAAHVATALGVDGAPGATDPAAGMELAWNAHDAAAVAELYTEDVVIINPIAGLLIGRPAALAGHVGLFAGPYKGSHRATQVDRVTYLTGTIAAVDLTVRLTNYVFLPPGLRPTSPGLVMQRERQIVVKRDGTWRIMMVQITPFPPAP